MVFIETERGEACQRGWNNTLFLRTSAGFNDNQKTKEKQNNDIIWCDQTTGINLPHMIRFSASLYV